MAGNETNLSQDELNERIAILRRFRTLLEQQRTKFREYLNVLELQESKINMEDADALIAHSELESQIVAGINSLQKVIVPMQELYQHNESSYTKEDSSSIFNIQSDLQKLQMQVLSQNEKNRTLLKSHLEELKQQMASMRNPYGNHKSAYMQQASTGNHIVIDV